MNELIELVKELNVELYERFGEVEKLFEYSTNGFADIISFNGALIWNSEIDDREFIQDKNDYEDLKPHIIKLFNSYIEKMNSLSL
jgi:hypothetical protein